MRERLLEELRYPAVYRLHATSLQIVVHFNEILSSFSARFQVQIRPKCSRCALGNVHESGILFLGALLMNSNHPSPCRILLRVFLYFAHSCSTFLYRNQPLWNNAVNMRKTTSLHTSAAASANLICMS